MENKTIKISERNYKLICTYAGELQKEIGKPVSVDKALSFILEKRKLSDLAGAWKMDDKLADEIMNNLRKGWSKWKMPSA